MSKMKKKPTSGKRLAPKPASTNVTHEPLTPVDWPHGHVRAELTCNEDDECVKIWIHGHTHYLHATTARELEKMLGSRLAEYNKKTDAMGMPGV
jgi:hypothetical protein